MVVLDSFIRLVIFIMPKTSGYAKNFNDNKLISFSIDHDNLLEKYKGVWSKIVESKYAGLTKNKNV